MAFKDNGDGTATITRDDGSVVEVYRCRDGSKCDGKGWVANATEPHFPCKRCRGSVRCPRCGQQWIDPTKYKLCRGCENAVAGVQPPASTGNFAEDYRLDPEPPPSYGMPVNW